MSKKKKKTKKRNKPARAGKALPAAATSLAVLDEPAPKAAPIRPGKLMTLAINDVIPTPDNPRVVQDADPRVAELAESIRQRGLLQPVLVRPHPKKRRKYDLRAGERRWRACRLAGLDKIKAFVVEMDDALALDATIIENLQREDLSPLEESRGIRKLIDAGRSVREIGARLGMSPATVSRRANLGSLDESILKLMNAGELSAWGRAHFEYIARFPGNVQARIVKILKGSRHGFSQLGCTLDELQELTSDELNLLDGKRWDLDDARLVPDVGACSKCPKRSSCNPLLFAKLNGNGKAKGAAAAKSIDRCLDLECFERKSIAARKSRLEKQRDKWPGLIAVETKDHNNQVDYREENALGLMSPYSMDHCKKSAKGAFPCVTVSKSGLSEIWFGKSRNGSSGQNAKPAKGKATPLTERRKMLNCRRLARAIDKLREALKKTAWPIKEYKNNPAGWAWLMQVASSRGVKCSNWTASVPSKILTPAVAANQLWLSIRPNIDETLNYYQVSSCNNQASRAPAIAKAIGFDWKGAVKESTKGIPEPKAWANLNADGTPKGSKKSNPKKRKAAPKKK